LSVAKQPAELTVHLNSFTPDESPATAVLKRVEVAKTPAPDTMVQVPCNGAGSDAASVAVVAHTVWSGPALDIPSNLLTTTSSVRTHVGFVPFVMVHLKMFAPELRPVTVAVGEAVFEKVPAPLITVQTGVPTDGAFAAKVAELLQTDWSGPAAGSVGRLLRTDTLSFVEQVPILIVHL